MDDFFDNKHIPKDIENLLKELFLHKKMGAVAIMDEIVDDINKANIQNNRFEKLKIALTPKYPSNKPIRGAVDGLVYTMFKSAFGIYYIKNISVNKEARIILSDAFSKKTLNEVAE